MHLPHISINLNIIINYTPLIINSFKVIFSKTLIHKRRRIIPAAIDSCNQCHQQNPIITAPSYRHGPACQISAHIFALFLPDRHHQPHKKRCKKKQESIFADAVRSNLTGKQSSHMQSGNHRPVNLPCLFEALTANQHIRRKNNQPGARHAKHPPGFTVFNMKPVFPERIFVLQYQGNAHNQTIIYAPEYITDRSAVPHAGKQPDKHGSHNRHRMFTHGRPFFLADFVSLRPVPDITKENIT